MLVCYSLSLIFNVTICEGLHMSTTHYVKKMVVKEGWCEASTAGLSVLSCNCQALLFGYFCKFSDSFYI